jgi:hypothetical protein
LRAALSIAIRLSGDDETADLGGAVSTAFARAGFNNCSDAMSDPTAITANTLAPGTPSFIIISL